jgi:hypothetical protein
MARVVASGGVAEKNKFAGAKSTMPPLTATRTASSLLAMETRLSPVGVLILAAGRETRGPEAGHRHPRRAAGPSTGPGHQGGVILWTPCTVVIPTPAVTHPNGLFSLAGKLQVHVREGGNCF